MEKIVTQKQCYICKQFKNLEEFNKDRTTVDGIGKACKLCAKMKSKKWYIENKEKAKLCQQKNYNKKYRPNLLTEDEKEDIIKRKILFEIRSNTNYAKERMKEYRENNKERLRTLDQNYRTRKNNSFGKIKTSEWIKLKDEYDNKCLCCGRKDVALTIDHIVPLSKGGTNTIDNIQPLCKSCNSKKHTNSTDYRNRR